MLYRDTMYYEFKQIFCQYPQINKSLLYILSSKNYTGALQWRRWYWIERDKT